MVRSKTKSSPPPKINYKALYKWASDDLLNECTTLTTIEDVENHRGDPHLYNFNAFCHTHDAHISVRYGTPGEPVCVDDKPGVGPPFSSCTKQYSNALVCAFHLHPSRGNSSRRSTRPPPSYTVIAGPSSGPFKFSTDIWAFPLPWTSFFISSR